MTINADDLVAKWAPVLEHSEAPALKSQAERRVIAQLLENQHEEITTKHSVLAEATPTNVTGGFAKWDPVLISMVRRSSPQLIANDIVGVQAMTGPTGLIFAMKSRYTNQSGTEALFNEANSAFSGNSSDNTAGHTTPVATDTEEDPFATSGSPATRAYTTGKGRTTAEGEGDIAATMAASIDSISVTARTRALKTEYSLETAQDLMKIHGMDAESEFSNILSEEMTAEMNREIVRTVYIVAKPGAQDATNSGIFDLSTDTNGRWLVERFKGLLFQIDREANRIMFDTRRKRGNMLIVSADVGSALAQAGYLDYQGALTKGTGVSQSFDESTFVGVLSGRYRVYVDPYVTNNDYFVVGYKNGSNPMDAGLFFCPYVPFQLLRAVDENSFQPKLAFKTRYGLVANPFVESSADTPDAETMTADINQYYRKVDIANLT